MDKDFGFFWTTYLADRSDYRDDAWENILRRKISDQPRNTQKKIIDNLIDKLINNEKEYSDWAFETFHELADNEQLLKLQTYTTELIKKETPYLKYADLIVFFIRKDFAFIRNQVEKILTDGEINHSWKYILKNVFKQDSAMFLTGLRRHVNDANEFGFDVGTFIKYNARQFVFSLQEFRPLEKELEKY